MEVNAIMTDFDGVPQVSDDHGLTWKRFEGLVINTALTEHYKEMNELRAAKAEKGK